MMSVCLMLPRLRSNGAVDCHGLHPARFLLDGGKHGLSRIPQACRSDVLEAGGRQLASQRGVIPHPQVLAVAEPGSEQPAYTARSLGDTQKCLGHEALGRGVTRV